MRHSGRRAVFFDRDGTLNVEVNYLRRVEDVLLVPSAADALNSLSRAGFLLVAVTNQAGIARGLLDETMLGAIHERLQALLAAEGARLDAIYFCPHHPEFSGACGCRKPLPGMLLQAASELGIDLDRSWMVGDTAADIVAGQAAGCRSILVRTGYGASYSHASAVPQTVADDVLGAASYILSRSATAE